MSSFKCLSCSWVNRYEPDSEFRRLWEVFEEIYYCYDCSKKYNITHDIHGKEIEDVDEMKWS
jgi:hypothetical protein